MGEEEKVVYLQGLIYRWQYIFSIGIVLDEKGANQVITRFAPFLHPKFKVISIFCGERDVVHRSIWADLSISRKEAV